jgi:ubiquinone/menaquinone biosynthesis C-methylase UbiE
MKHSYADPALWDDRVAEYETNAEPFTRQFAERALDLLSIMPGERLLDVGAGTGALALPAAARGAKVLAVDFSPAMVSRLRARLRALGEMHDTQVMDGQALAIPDRSFDVTASIFGVILFERYEAGLSELARVTRPGGRAVIASWARPEGAGPNLLFHEVYEELFPDGLAMVMPNGLVETSNPISLRLAMNRAGFRDVTVETLERPFTLPSPTWLADRADMLFQQIPRWTALSSNDKQRLRDAFAARTEQQILSAAHIALGRR